MVSFLITVVGNFSFSADILTVPPTPAEIETAYCSTQSSVCGTAPEQFTFLMDFVREMTNAIKTIWTDWTYLGKYVNPNWFVWNTFTPPKQSLLTKALTNISQKLQFGVATTAIFSSPSNVAGLKDMLWWVVLLAKNHVFLRDNKLVEQMESLVDNKKYELGLWWWWYAQIIPQNRTILTDIIKKYIDKWLLTEWSVNDGAMYNNVTSLLTQTLTAAKSFLYFGSIDQFSSITKWGADQPIFIRFNDVAFQKIQRDYNCARWPNYICSAQHQSLKKIFSTTWKSLFGSGWSLKSVTKTVKLANERLSQIFSKNQTQAFKDREAELLKSMYGTTKVSKGTLSDSLKKSWDSIKKTWTGLAQEFVDLGNDVNTFRTFPKNLKGTVQALPPSPNPVDYSSGTLNIIKTLDAYVSDIFVSQKTDLDLVSLTEVRGVTPAFAVLWQQIAVIKNSILGGKDVNNSLIQGLWVSCELQCGNWWLCR